MSALGSALFVVAGCGAGTAAARSSTGAGRSRRTVNPAMRAGLEIVRLQPVVPFTPQQIQQLVPVLQSLAADPNLPPDQLAAKAQQIENVFTATQKTALTNMAAAGETAPGQRSGGFRRGAGGAGGFAAGAGPNAPRTSGPGAGPGRRNGFSPSAVYQLAIDTLQGTVGPQGASGSTAGPGGAAGAV